MGEVLLLDASALLASLFREPGAVVVEAALIGDVALSSVNMAEILSKLGPRHPGGHAGACERLRELDVALLPFGVDEAERTGALLAAHRGRLSLGDAACLATASLRGLPVLTADRAWASLGLPVEIRLVR